MTSIFEELKLCGDALNTIFGIEEAVDGNGKLVQKQVHFYGYGYHVGIEDKHPCRFLEYTHFYAPLIEVIEEGIDKVENEGSDRYKQYITDCTEDEMKEIYNTYDNGNVPKIVHELTMDMPCGTYVLV